MDKDLEKVFEVRCPETVTTKNGYKFRCNQLGCKVTAGSVIRIKCRHCKTLYEAYVPENAKDNNDVAYRIINGE